MDPTLVRYLERVEQCLSSAASTRSSETREMWLRVAGVYVELMAGTRGSESDAAVNAQAALERARRT